MTSINFLQSYQNKIAYNQLLLIILLAQLVVKQSLSGRKNMTIDPEFEKEPAQKKALEEDISKNHETAPLTDEEKVAESTASGSLDIQAAEREMNRHLNEAGLLYQNLGESLRKMETVQKRIFLEQQSSIAKINLLKSQIHDQEEQAGYQKMVVKFLIALSLILGIATIVLVMMLKKESGQTQISSQNEQSITELIKRLEQAQNTNQTLPKPAIKPTDPIAEIETTTKPSEPEAMVEILTNEIKQNEDAPNLVDKPKASTNQAQPIASSDITIEVKTTEKTDKAAETNNNPSSLDTQTFELTEPEEKNKETENLLPSIKDIEINKEGINQTEPKKKKSKEKKPKENESKDIKLKQEDLKTQIKDLESSYFKSLDQPDPIKANEYLNELLKLDPEHYLKAMLSTENSKK